MQDSCWKTQGILLSRHAEVVRRTEEYSFKTDDGSVAADSTSEDPSSRVPVTADYVFGYATPPGMSMPFVFTFTVNND